MKRILTTIVAVAALAAVPASASAAVRSGSITDPQGDATALSGAALDIQSVAVTYDDGAGTLRIVWQYYTNLSQLDTSSPGSPIPQDGLSVSAPLIPYTPTPCDAALVSWSMSDTLHANLQLTGSTGFLAGSASLSQDGHTLTAEFADSHLAGCDWRKVQGSGMGGDTFERFYFDGYSEPAPVQYPGTGTPAPNGGTDESRVGMTSMAGRSTPTTPT